jgi:hypothetical protein
MRTVRGMPPHAPVKPGPVHVIVVAVMLPPIVPVPLHVPPVAPGVVSVKLPLNVLSLSVPETAPLHACAATLQVPPIEVPVCVSVSVMDCWGKLAESRAPDQVPATWIDGAGEGEDGDPYPQPVSTRAIDAIESPRTIIRCRMGPQLPSASTAARSSVMWESKTGTPIPGAAPVYVGGSRPTCE